MKASSYKSHLIISNRFCMNLKLRNINIEKSTCEQLPGVKVDSKLLDEIIKKTSPKVSALLKIWSLSLSQT